MERGMLEEIWPWEFTNTEGGNFNFSFWTLGPVTYKQLEDMVGKGETATIGTKTVMISNQPVHSLIFESAAAGHGNYARWDCINGWTTTIAQARKAWPDGLHGERPAHLYRWDKHPGREIADDQH